MLSFIMQLNLSGKLLGAMTMLGATLMMLQLPGPVNVDTSLKIYQGEQWEALQKFEISPSVLDMLESNDPNAAGITSQLNKLRAAADTDANLAFNQTTRSDGWAMIEAGGTGVGLQRLNDLFFDGQAQIVAVTVEGTAAINIRQNSIDSTTLVNAGGSNTVRITGQRILLSDADQVQLNATAIWTNPSGIEVTFTEASGTPINPVSPAQTSASAPAAGGEQPTPEPKVQPAQMEDVDLIRNGDFEEPWAGLDGTAPEWAPYSNGGAHIGWYQETWPEAVFAGEQAQLMEIFEVEDVLTNRVIAIHQTVDVVPDAEYELTLYVMMRTSADPEFRNKSEFEMHWGIDPFGEGNYDDVEEWVLMPLEEQARLGSTGEYPDDVPLFYEQITGTVRTAPNSDKITLFIRGLKKFANNVEVNFDVDRVSLVGPPPGAEVATKPVEPASPTEDDAKLPTSGAVLSTNASVGMLAVGGLILVIIGAAATVKLLGIKLWP